MAERVGFIGLGTMGLPMATNLVRAGHALAVHDVNPAAVEAARALGPVEACPSPGAVAERAEVVFTCLPDDAAVRSVYLDPGGVAAGARPGALSCDCSTVSPETTLAVHAALAARGARHLDTPMLGSQPQAVSGEIFFIVGGDPDALGRVEPYLRAMGRQWRHVGPAGTANRIKLMHNGLAAVVSVAAAEALATCARAGVDLDTFVEVVRQGGGMAYGTYWERRARRVCQGDYTPTFLLRHMLKDVSLALDHARKAGVPVPLLEEARRTYAEAAARGWGGLDFSAVTRVLEARIGRPLGRPNPPAVA